MRRAAFGGTLVLVAVALAVGCNTKSPGGSGGELDVLCAAGIRPAMEPIKVAFEKEYGCTVRVNYAGSGTLFGSLQAGSEADVYLPGDIWYIHKANDKGSSKIIVMRTIGSRLRAVLRT